MKQSQVCILTLQLSEWFDLYIGDTVYYVGLSVNNTKDTYKKFANAYHTVNTQQTDFHCFCMPISSNRWQKRLRVPGL